MQLTDHEKAMLDGRDGPAVQKAMDLLMRYGEALGAERLVETQQCLRHHHRHHARSSATSRWQGGGMDAVFSEFSLDSQQVVQIPKFKTFTSHLQLGFDPEPAGEIGPERRDRAVLRQERAPRGRPGREDPEHLHALPGRQRPDARRALRLDGVVGGRLLQLGARRAHQYRRPRELRRRHADRPHSRLGLSPRRAAPRHPCGGTGRGGRVGPGLGPAGLLHRRPGAGARAGGVQPARHRPRAEPAAAEALRRRGLFLRRRGDVPHRRRDTGGVHAGAGAGRQHPGRGVPLRRGAAARHLRKNQRDRQGRRGPVRDAGLPALHDRADPGSRATHRRPQGPRELRAVDLHAARDQVAWPTATATPRSSRTPAAS